MRATKIAVASLVAIVLLAGCKSKSKYETLRDKPIKVEISVVGGTCENITQTYIGEVLAQGEIPLTFQLGGEITSIAVKNGAKVVRGQVIAKVDDTQQKNLLESSNAVLHQAEDGYARLEKVHAKGGVSDVKWVEMQTNLTKAQSMAQTALKNYNDCTLRATENGIVNLADIHVGTRLAPGQRIGSLLTMNGMRVEFTVPETDVAQIKKGESITVEVPALGRTFQAKVSEKDMVSTHLSHNYTVRANISAADAKELLQGMVCKIRVNSSTPEGIVVPARSIQMRTDGVNVWVVKNGRAERRNITINEYVADGVMVGSGLEVGDTVITLGGQKMFNGAIIEY